MMANFWSRFRIGEKIGLATAIVGALFLLVIAEYHLTLRQAVDDYQVLEQVYEAKEDYAQAIALALASADAAVQGYFVDRGEARVAAFQQLMRTMQQAVQALGQLDAQGREAAARLAPLTEFYRDSFVAIVDAWRVKGVDHDSGLQGAFRDTVHRLEDLAGQYKVSELYNQLLQIRRGEKDLALRRDPAYRQRVLDLVQALGAAVRASALAVPVKERFLGELDVYRGAFEAFAGQVLEGQEVQGGKGPFREAAHRIEDLLTSHMVADMEVHILQLRRREKDYLLRHDKRYVDMALTEWGRVRDAVERSAIADDEKAELLGLTEAYRRDFLALVAQNDHIDRLMADMRQAADDILPVVENTVQGVNRAVAEVSERVDREADESSRRMLWIVLAASLLGILLSALITRQIAGSLLRMAGFLDRLACEEPVDRIPVRPGARDELNAMAESVNKMADHKANLVAWWKRSVGAAGGERPPSSAA